MEIFYLIFISTLSDTVRRTRERIQRSSFFSTWRVLRKRSNDFPNNRAIDSNKNDVNTVVYRNTLLHALLDDEEEHVALSVCLADMR